MLLFLIAIALLAGGTATLVTVAWIAPPLIRESVFSQRGNGRAASNALDPTVMSDSRQRVISIFDSSKKVNGAVYPRPALAGYAALLSSDGWAVTAATYRPGKEKNWEGIDHQGIVHKIEQVVEDRVSHLTYIKFGGTGFRLMAFAPWDTIDIGVMLWSLNGRNVPIHQTDWKLVTVADPALSADNNPYPIWQPVQSYRLEPHAEAGAIVINDRGELAGFADEKGAFIGGWLVEGQLSRLLSSAPLRYDSVPWEGYMIAGVAMNGVVKTNPGFYVAKSAAAPVNLVRKGDIVLRIGSRLVDAVSLPRALLLAPAEFPVTIWRGGQEKEITVKKAAQTVGY